MATAYGFAGHQRYSSQQQATKSYFPNRVQSYPSQQSTTNYFFPNRAPISQHDQWHMKSSSNNRPTINYHHHNHRHHQTNNNNGIIPDNNFCIFKTTSSSSRDSVFDYWRQKDQQAQRTSSTVVCQRQDQSINAANGAIDPLERHSTAPDTSFISTTNVNSSINNSLSAASEPEMIPPAIPNPIGQLYSTGRRSLVDSILSDHDVTTTNSTSSAILTDQADYKTTDISTISSAYYFHKNANYGSKSRPIGGISEDEGEPEEEKSMKEEKLAIVDQFLPPNHDPVSLLLANSEVARGGGGMRKRGFNPFTDTTSRAENSSNKSPLVARTTETPSFWKATRQHQQYYITPQHYEAYSATTTTNTDTNNSNSQHLGHSRVQVQQPSSIIPAHGVTLAKPSRNKELTDDNDNSWFSNINGGCFGWIVNMLIIILAAAVQYVLFYAKKIIQEEDSLSEKEAREEKKRKERLEEENERENVFEEPAVASATVVQTTTSAAALIQPKRVSRTTNRKLVVASGGLVGCLEEQPHKTDPETATAVAAATSHSNTSLSKTASPAAFFQIKPNQKKIITSRENTPVSTVVVKNRPVFTATPSSQKPDSSGLGENKAGLSISGSDSWKGASQYISSSSRSRPIVGKNYDDHQGSGGQKLFSYSSSLNSSTTAGPTNSSNSSNSSFLSGPTTATTQRNSNRSARYPDYLPEKLAAAVGSGGVNYPKIFTTTGLSNSRDSESDSSSRGNSSSRSSSSGGGCGNANKPDIKASTTKTPPPTPTGLHLDRLPRAQLLQLHNNNNNQSFANQEISIRSHRQETKTTGGPGYDQDINPFQLAPTNPNLFYIDHNNIHNRPHSSSSSFGITSGGNTAITGRSSNPVLPAVVKPVGEDFNHRPQYNDTAAGGVSSNIFNSFRVNEIFSPMPGSNRGHKRSHGGKGVVRGDGQDIKISGNDDRVTNGFVKAYYKGGIHGQQVGEKEPGMRKEKKPANPSISKSEQASGLIQSRSKTPARVPTPVKTEITTTILNTEGGLEDLLDDIGHELRLRARQGNVVCVEINFETATDQRDKAAEGKVSHMVERVVDSGRRGCDIWLRSSASRNAADTTRKSGYEGADGQEEEDAPDISVVTDNQWKKAPTPGTSWGALRHWSAGLMHLGHEEAKENHRKIWRFRKRGPNWDKYCRMFDSGMSQHGTSACGTGVRINILSLQF